MPQTGSNRLQRREVVKQLVAERGDMLAVGSLGGPSLDLNAADNHPLNFTMRGAMGSSTMIGLGLALGQPERRVLVVAGDGEMMMAMGTLATIAVLKPINLSVVVIDNGTYAETGGQTSHTAHGVDLAEIALAAGFAWAGTVESQDELDAADRRLREMNGPGLVAIEVSRDKPPPEKHSRNPQHVKNRFRETLLGKA